MDDEELSGLIRRQASRHAASEHLRAAVRTQVALQAAAQPMVRQPRRGWLGTAAGFAFGAALTLAVTLAVPLLPAAEPTADELVAAHVRALGPGPLIEVASSDRHTVKPWFQGRIDYAPPVLDLAEAGFPLAGGRVQRIGGHDVAVLAYRRRAHVIDLFVWPGTGAAPPSRAATRGFSTVRWRDGTMQFWAIADTDGDEMERFVAAWNAAALSRPSPPKP